MDAKDLPQGKVNNDDEAMITVNNEYRPCESLFQFAYSLAKWKDTNIFFKDFYHMYSLEYSF